MKTSITGTRRAWLERLQGFGVTLKIRTWTHSGIEITERWRGGDNFKDIKMRQSWLRNDTVTWLSEIGVIKNLPKEKYDETIAEIDHKLIKELLSRKDELISLKQELGEIEKRISQIMKEKNNKEEPK